MAAKYSVKKAYIRISAILLLLLTFIGLTRSALPTLSSTKPTPETAIGESEATQLPVQPTPTPTSLPDGSPATSSISLFNETQMYQNPLGLFQAPVPEVWQVSEETEDWVRFTDSQGGQTVEVRVTQTGLELDGAGFARLVTAREANSFSAADGYQQTLVSIVPKEKRALVEKEQQVDGRTQKITSCYRGIGVAVLAVDIRSGSGADASAYPVGMEWVDQISLDAAALANLETYADRRNIMGEAGLYYFSVPVDWTDQTTRREDATVRDFVSPDQHLVIQVMQYDYGESLSRSQAGRFALTLLPGLYASDLLVLTDRTRSDNLEYVTWSSASRQIQGTSYFSSQGQYFLLFTVMVDTEYASFYSATIDQIISNFGM